MSLCFCLIFALAACKPPNKNQQSDSDSVLIDLRLRAAPSLGAADVEVLITEDGQAVSGAQVELVGDMTHAGMIPVLSSTQDVGGGLYQSEGFEFTMAGDWIISAEVVLPDGDKQLAELKVTVPSR